MFFDHSEIKLQINNTRKIEKPTYMRKLNNTYFNYGFPWYFSCNSGDPSSIPGPGRSAGEGIGYPLQYSWISLVAQLVKESACNAGDLGSIPGLGRSPGERARLPIPVFGLENSMDCIVHGVAKSQTQLSDWTELDYTIHGILQARILEWVAIPFSRASSQPRDRAQVSHIAGRFFYQLSHQGSQW